MRRAGLLLIAVSASLAATACASAAVPGHDAAVSRFCADTAGIEATLNAPAVGPAATASLAELERRLSEDVSALQQAGDVTVAAEGALIQSLISSQITGGELQAGPNPQLQRAAAMVADARNRSC